MSRYIDEELLLQKLSRMIDYCEKNKDKKFNALSVLFQVGDAIMDCPTADVVEVVRCKDCKCYEKGSNESEGWEYCRRTGVNCNANDFCSYGERREQ